MPPKRPKLDDSNTVLNSVLNISDISHLQASSGDIGVHQASAKHSPQVRSAGRGRARRSLGSLPSEQSKPGNQSSVPPGQEDRLQITSIKLFLDDFFGYKDCKYAFLFHQVREIV